MSWIKTAKVGDKVQCLYGAWKIEEMERGLISVPQANSIYTIRTIDPGEDGGIYLRFMEIINPELNYLECLSEVRFTAEKFRPLQTRPTSIAVFERLLNTAPAQLEEA